jgi:Terminase RNaseH-like domain
LTPLDYLAHSFFEKSGEGGTGDTVVWACRGGGKTTIGAVATLLDLLFKPGIQIRILGGSFEQSEKMYAYLRQLMERHFALFLKNPPTRRRLELHNGSRVDVLAQSNRSIRGQRVQKLRCDEVELFDPTVWQAAQLTTRTLENGKPRPVRGTLEVFSTMHQPGGLMQQILADGTTRRDTFAWCVWDVIEKCPESRHCATCPLWESCQGRAKHADGFVPIEDVLAMKSRISHATWQHEMLCHPPRFENAVFPAFRRDLHLAEVERRPAPGQWIFLDGRRFYVETIIAGVDFGYAGAFVCLWIAMLREGHAIKGPRAVWIFDELVTREQTVARNAEAMRLQSRELSTVYCDVAGRHTNSQTGRTDERVLRDAGFATRCRAMKIDEGIGMIADLLEPALGGARLFINPHCTRLIAAFEGYRRGPDGKPEKDGAHDHLIDALRYAIVNHDSTAWKLETRYY